MDGWITDLGYSEPEVIVFITKILIREIQNKKASSMMRLSILSD
jgi:hypothetical protein